MLAAAAPGEKHKLLKQMVGRWDIASKFWMAPDAPPMESKGSSSIKLVLGGRFVQQDYRGAFMGIKFQGLGEPLLTKNIQAILKKIQRKKHTVIDHLKWDDFPQRTVSAAFARLFQGRAGEH